MSTVMDYAKMAAETVLILAAIIAYAMSLLPYIHRHLKILALLGEERALC